MAKPGSESIRKQAANRGTKAHSHCEYILKTASQLIRNTCNERNSWTTYEDGLARSPKSITEWAIKKAKGGSPKVHWLAELHARGLADWIDGGSITSIHSIEFSIYHPLGFAGTADCLLDIDGKLTITDFKTTGSSKDKPDKYLEDLVQKISRLQKQQNERMGTQKPVLYKISPDNNEKDLVEISHVFNKFSVDGVIVTNTTNNHDGLNSDLKVPGGLSGAPLEQRALLCLKKIRPLLNKDIAIIASGGIMSKEAVAQRIRAGASLVQIYTGLIYEGPKIVSDSLKNL